jgi:hypothetical protein
MAKKDLLFDLIRSLSKAEKRYFKLYCKQSETDSNYLRLFEAIDTKKEYDEKSLRKKFKGEAFTRQLHVTKNYLRQLILKSLRNFHGKISKDAELKDALRNVEILYHKELYSLCHAELKKAETIARSFELNNGLIEILGWKRKLEQQMHSQHYTRFTELLNEQEHTIHVIHNTNLYWQQAVNISRTAISISPANGKKIKFVKELTLEDAQSLEAKVLFYNTAYLSFLRNGLQDKAEQSLVDLLGLLETLPLRIKEDPAIYISSANNLMSYLVFSKQYDKAIALINRARAFYENSMQQHEKKSLLKQILRSYNMELEIYRDKKAFEKNLPFIEHVELFISRYVAKIPSDYLLSFWFQLANIHFMRKDFDRSLKWINLILNNRALNLRIDLQVHARMLNLLIHLEQDNLFVLRYFVDSTRRFMKKVKYVQPFEQTLLGFFSKVGQTPRFELKDKFKDLQQKLFSSKSAPVPANTLDYVDYKRWIEGKLVR